MEDILKKIFEKNFYTPKGLLAGAILIFFVSISTDSFLEKGIPAFFTRCIIYASFILIWAIVWLYLRTYLPANPKDKIGILIAIVTENDKQKVRIKNDLLDGINKLLKNYKLSQKINVIVLEDFKSNRAIDVVEKYLEKKDEYDRANANLEKENKLKKTRESKNFEGFVKKVNCQFYLWGRIKERLDVENNYYIDLKGLVTHKPLKRAPAEMLKKEFALALPSEISFPEKMEVKGFELTSELIFIAAMYITGCAAYLSDDPFTAYELHKNLQNELNKFTPIPPNLQNMPNNLKVFLVNEYAYMAQIYSSKGDFMNAEKVLKEAESIDNNIYGLLVFQSYYAFDKNKDIQKALEYINKASKVSGSDYLWLYNRAFIYMYAGEYEKGLNDYKKLEKVKISNEFEIVSQCIEYDMNLLEKEPEKYQLLFMLGYLYYFKKGDLKNSLLYFKEFLEKAKGDESYEYLYARAQTYVSEIEKKIGKGAS